MSHKASYEEQYFVPGSMSKITHNYSLTKDFPANLTQLYTKLPRKKEF